MNKLPYSLLLEDTAPINQQRGGLLSTITSVGGAQVRTYADVIGLAQTGNIEYGFSQNCAIDLVNNVWLGRDVTDICFLEKWTDTGGLKEFWYAPSGAAGSTPTWQKVESLDLVNAIKSITGSLRVSGDVSIPSMNGGQLGAFRNKIINGDMQVSQVSQMYGSGAVTPTTGVYISDQWNTALSQASKLTFQQVVDAPAGFKYSTKITVAAQYAPIATEMFVLFQPVEGQNIVDFQLGTGGAVTLATSNYIKGSIAGVYSVALRNGAANRTYLGTINVTTAWVKVVITLSGDTTGTWVNDNTVGLYWSLDLGSGTNYNTTSGTWQAGSFLRTVGSVTFVNQVAGSTLNITGVQLEQVSPGATQGTAFEHVPYSTQLSWCQRYLPCWNSVIASSGFSSGIQAPVSIQSATVAQAIFPLPVQTRVPVTGIVVVSPTLFSIAGTSTTTVSTIVLSSYNWGTSSLIVQCSSTGMAVGAGSLYSTTAACQLYGTGAQM